MSKAFKAIREFAEAAGATDVREDGNTVVVDYKGSVVRVSRDMSSSKNAWNGVVDDLRLGIERAPSGAFKRAVKIVDRRRHDEAAAVEALHNVCADKGATLVSLSDERVVVDYEGDEVVATKGALFWKVECKDILSSCSPHAWGGIKFVICKLEDRAELEERMEEEPAEVEEPVRDYPIDEDPADDDAPLLTDLAEVRNAVEDVFQNGDADHATPVDELREMCDIAPEVDDEEILEALAEAVRDEGAPVLVMTFGTDRVAMCADVGCDNTPAALDAALEVVAGELSDISGEKARLVRVGDGDEGRGVLHAFRMPAGDYTADDMEAVDRFGVEIGRYRLMTDDELLLARVETGLGGCPYHTILVDNGVCELSLKGVCDQTIGRTASPQDSFDIRVIASEEGIETWFTDARGHVDYVAAEPCHADFRRFDFERFVDSPLAAIRSDWRAVVRRRADRFPTLSLETAMEAA